MMCESKDLLVAFLYGEIDAGERRTFQTHLNTCAACREELAGLRATRGQIASWTPPEPDFGFRIVRGAAAPPPAPRFRIAPAWGVAAAAVLVMAMAAAIANVEVRYGGDGLVVRTGWNRGGGMPSATVQGVGGAALTPADWNVQAAALDRRLRELETFARAQAPAPAQMASAARISDAEVLSRVREMLGHSETRQQREFAARIAQLARDFDTQRRLDLASIDQGMTRLQNTSGAEVKQYRDLIQRMYRATYQQNALQLQQK
jgi:putative zinc finger protein